MNLLLVDDDQSQNKVLQDAVDIFNSTSDINITLDIATNYTDGLKKIQTLNNYDGAIIDLRLEKNDAVGLGNNLIKEIVKELRFPVRVITTHKGDLEPELQIENILFKCRGRGEEEYEDVLNEFKKIFLTGITQILGAKGTIDKQLSKIFWDHLSSSMDIWINDDKRTPEQKQKTLLRYILLHVQEYLELTEESNFENYHAAEIYITPPIKNNLFTGDLVIENESGKRFIVLTPSCDLAQLKAKDILLSEAESEEEGLLFEKTRIIKNGKGDADKLELAQTELKALIGNHYSNKYHFLPKYNSIKSGLINFQKLKSVRVKDFNENFERIASINSTFTKDIIARFSYYYSRQGSPDFNIDEIYESLIN